MSTYQEAFGVRTLNRFVETFRENKGNMFLSSLFGSDTADGEMYEWDQLDFPRDLAPITGPDAPSKNTKELGKTHKYTSLAHIKLNKRIPGRRIFLMERGAGQLTPDAVGHVAREIKDMRNKIEKTIEYLHSKAFTGSVVVSSATITDTDVSFTITFSVQTFTKTTSWATSSTNILSDANELILWKKNYSDTVGFPLRDMIFSYKVGSYLLGNQQVEQWLAKTNRGVEIFEIGHINKMSDLNWIQYDGNYKPVGGSVTRFIADDKIIGLPDAGIRSQYLVTPLGKGMIPRTAIGAEADMLMSPAPQNGWYSYATLVEDDPPVMKIVLGWIGLPIIIYPDVVSYGTVA